MMNLKTEEIKVIAELPYSWEKIKDKTILVSGGTGFIGTAFVDVIKYRNQKYNENIKVISFSRRGGESSEYLECIKANVKQPLHYEGKIDYIIHLASNTHPKQYAEDPIGTIMTNIYGCDNLLKLAVEKKARFLLASSVEIYGQGTAIPMNEEYCGYIDCNLARSGYNEAKRTCEALTQSYRSVFGVNAVIARFARVFGADKKHDTKAMSQFMDKAVLGEDIILKSKGQQRYSYCYIADAVSGLLKLLLDGQDGEAYNISNDDDGLTLGEYAEYIASLANLKVRYEIENNESVSKATFALLDGAHIFHTNNKRVWEYITQFAEFNRFTNSPVANYKGELYSLPFNMYTFNKMWGVVTPEEASVKIEEQRKEAGITEPKNLEEQAISLVGRDIYEKLIKGYTEKQWGRDCKDLPSFIIKRLPVRLTFDNNYFNALYQGIPVGGYTKMVANLLDGIEVRLNMDYLDNKAELDALADKVVYTGAIDAYFDYKLGTLEYRSVRFETETLDKPNFQGNAAVNYTDRETPWTRIIEHKWFEFGKDEDGNELPKTVISREFSSEWKTGDEPYYPVNDEKNGALYAEYKKLAGAEEKVIFGGRLGEYKYYDMDAVIASALDMCEKELQ